MILEDLRAADRLQKGEEDLPSDAYLKLVEQDYFAGDLLDRLAEENYAIVNLHRMGDVVVVTRNGEVSLPESVPSGYVVYTLEELLRMGEFGKAARFNTVDYRRIHLVKKLLGATVIS